MTSVEKLFQSARSLPKRKRAELAQLLLTSLAAPDPHADLSDEEWVAEMTRRAKAAARSDWKGAPWETALTQLRQGRTTRRK